MKMIDVSIGISARHVHLCRKTYDLLFNKELTVKNELNQIGQFAANETVTIKTDKNKIENVRIIGPLRDYDQVEISAADARGLGINPPVRASGDLFGASEITICTEKGEVTLNAAIIANRHVHMNDAMAKELGVVNDEVVKLELGGDKSGVIDVQVKVSSNGFFEVHLDTDDANAFLIKSNDKGKLLL